MEPDPIFPDPTPGSGPPHTEYPTALHQVHRRPLGIHPVPLLGVLGTVALLLAIVLLAAGSVVVGLALLGAAIASWTLFSGAIRREPDAPGGRFVLRAADRSRSLAGLVALSIRAWLRAALRLIRIRGRQHRLRSKLKGSLAPLGEAIHRGDLPRAEALKQQAAAIEKELEQSERAASDVLAAARHEISRERATIQPTRALAHVPEREPSANPQRRVP